MIYTFMTINMKGFKQLTKLMNNKINQQILNKFWKKLEFCKQQLPIQVNDFVELVSKFSEFYVDKSYFIKNVLQLDTMPVKLILITRPTGWGKSVNLSMLKYFIRKEVDENGIAIYPQPNRNTFTGGLFSQKQGEHKRQIKLPKLNIADNRISNYQSYVKAFNGISPVIYLQFGNARGQNFIQMKRKIIKQVLKQYEFHRYLKNTNKVSAYLQQIKQIQRLLKLEDKRLQKQSISFIVRGLQLMLQQFHTTDKKCYILIDDCDQPALSLLRATNSIQQARRAVVLIITILNPILSATKDLKIVATAKINVFQNLLTNYKNFTIFQDKFNDSFGFSQQQISNCIIANLLKNVKVETKNVQKLLQQKMKKWCGGYSGGNYCVQKIEPRCAIKYVQDCINTRQILDGVYNSEQGRYEWIMDKIVRERGIVGVLQLQKWDADQLKVEQLFTNSVEQLSQQQMNMVVYNMGLVTGVVGLGKCDIAHCRLPNLAISNTIQSYICTYLRKSYPKYDWNSYIDIHSAQKCCAQLQHLLNCIDTKQTAIDSRLCEGLFYYQYLLSSNKQFSTLQSLIDANTPTIISNIYVPIQTHTSTPIFIIQIRYVQISSLIYTAILQIFTTLLLSNHFKQCYRANQLLHQQIQEIVIRIILVVQQQQILTTIYPIKDIALDINQLKNIITIMQNPKNNQHIIQILNKQVSRVQQIISLIQILANTHHLNSIDQILELIPIFVHKNQQRMDQINQNNIQ